MIELLLLMYKYILRSTMTYNIGYCTVWLTTVVVMNNLEWGVVDIV